MTGNKLSRDSYGNPALPVIYHLPSSDTNPLHLSRKVSRIRKTNLLTSLLVTCNLLGINLLTSLIMAKPKGGRGYRAPYETHQIRVPDPIAPQVHSLIERYQDYLNTGGSPNTPPKLLDKNKVVDNFDEIQALRSRVAQLEDNLKAVDNFKANTRNTLENAMKLKANAGGAIKKEIEKVLKLL